MKLEAIHLQGQVKGNIWYPPVEAWKDFSKTFRVYPPHPATPNIVHSDEWTGLRDALLKITNDGDFQNCGISCLWGGAEYRDGRKRVEIDMKFNPAAEEYKDLLTKDFPSENFREGD